MAIAFDASSGVQQATNDSGPSWSHVLGSGSDRMVVVCMSWKDPDAADISGITFDGVAMTRVVGANAGPVNQYNSAIFYILETDLPVAGTYTVAVTWTTSHADLFVGGSLSFTGVNQAAPESSDGQSGSTTTTSASVTITSGAMIVANAASSDTGGVLGLAFDSGTENERWDADEGGLAGLASTVPDATAGAVGIDATASGNHNCALSAVSLAEAGAAARYTPRGFNRGVGRGISRGTL